MSNDQVRECGRVVTMKNRADIESTGSEVCRARILFSVTRKERRNGSRECAGHEEDTRMSADWVWMDAVRVLLTSRKDDLGKPGKKVRKTGQRMAKQHRRQRKGTESS